MDPSSFHPVPEDVIRDRLRIETTGEQLSREAEELAAKIKEASEGAAEHMVKNKVTVSVTPKGRIRKNGPCPCGSGTKFKKCCGPKVAAGQLLLPSPKAMRAYLKGQK